MEKSIVTISTRDDNFLDCSFAIVEKENLKIIIILRNSECGIFDYHELKDEKNYHYLLLKHYQDDESAYKDFLKLIGKMCKKTIDSKYFLNHKEEDNRIVYIDYKNEHMIEDDEKNDYDERYRVFKCFVEEKATSHLDSMCEEACSCAAE